MMQIKVGSMKHHFPVAIASGISQDTEKGGGSLIDGILLGACKSGGSGFSIEKADNKQRQ